MYTKVFVMVISLFLIGSLSAMYNMGQNNVKNNPLKKSVATTKTLQGSSKNEQQQGAPISPQKGSRFYDSY